MAEMTLPPRILPGQFWREATTCRRIKILESMVHDTGPAWTYVDASGNPEGDSEHHPDWHWHYCDLFDFTVWNRFVWEGAGNG